MKFKLLLVFVLLFSEMGFAKVRHYDLFDKILESPIIIKAKCIEIKTKTSWTGFEEAEEVQFWKLKTFKGDFYSNVLSFGETTIKAQMSVGCKGETKLKFNFAKGEQVMLFLSQNGKLLWKESVIDIEKIMEIMDEPKTAFKEQLILKYYATDQPALKAQIIQYVLKYKPQIESAAMKRIFLDCIENPLTNRNHIYQAYARLEEFYDRDLECLLLDKLNNGDATDKMCSMKILTNQQCDEAILPMQKLMVSVTEDERVKRIAAAYLEKF